ncbi:MAG TPA: tetratricopeptide repeat protein [bacterium]
MAIPANPPGKDRGHILSIVPWGAVLALAATLLVYLPGLGNGFTNWDDDHYVTANRFVQRLSGANLLHHATSFTAGNYHPLTLAVLSLIHRAFGPDPRAFHAASLLLHCANVALVLRLALRLGAGASAAGIAALLFGVHPLHVESVAWVAEFKDVLSAAFFFAAILAYLQYRDGTRRRLWYGLALASFLLSLLAKPMAVTLPVVLLLCDRLQGRRRDRAALIEKAPFFLLALLFGGVALVSQQSALRSGIFALGENLRIAAHGLLFYLAKAIVPTGLSALYQIPRTADGGLPPAFTWAPLVILPLVALAAWWGRRSRTAAFSALFFLVTLLPVLQIVPVGPAAAADRYFYIPSFGLFFAAGQAYAWLGERAARGSRWAGVLLPAGAAAVVLLFGGLARERVGVWKDSLTLWTDAIAKDPASDMAYGYRGMARAAAGDDTAAMADFDRALELGARRRFSAEVYYNRGALHQARGRMAQALADYDRALEIDPRAVRALVNRGNVLDTLGRTAEAVQDYERAMSLAPDDPLPRYNRGLVRQMAGAEEQAVRDYDDALRLDPGFTLALVNRGIAQGRLGRLSAAIDDFTRAAAIEPRSATVFENRAMAYAAAGDQQRAAADRERAQALAAERRPDPLGAAVP